MRRSAADLGLPTDTFVVRMPRLGSAWILHRRAVLVTAVVWPVVLVLAVLALTIGEYPITAADVVSVVSGGGTLIERDIVLNDRLPRVLTGVGVGVAFAVSGAVLQRIAMNPLATPDVLGINAGAAFGALVVITVLGGGHLMTVAGALAGALAAIAVILSIAYRNGLQGYRLVLVGIGVAALATAAISYLLTRAEIQQAMAAATWLTGSLANRSGLHVVIVATGLGLTLPVLVATARHLRLLELGDDVARSLTAGGSAAKVALLVVAVVLAAFATAAAGPIGFVALVAPQIARRLMDGRQAALAPAAAIGALLVVSADLAARTLFPTELPVGVLTAVLGAPVLLYLLARAQRIGAAG